MIKPIFFATSGGLSLFAVFRGAPYARRVWVVCPPFGEEDKSSRRTLTEVCMALQERGEASLMFAYRGTGDSEGEFQDCTLEEWREDILLACEQARVLSGAANVSLLGVRLGGSLALQVAPRVDATAVVLVEPLLSGRSFLMQQSVRRKLRNELTLEEGASSAGGSSSPSASAGEGATAAAAATVAPPSSGGDGAVEDLDGWPLSPELKASLQVLDLRKAGPAPAGSLLVQVGPREELTPAWTAFAGQIQVPAVAAVMPPFWNLLDYAPSGPLQRAILAHLFGEGSGEASPQAPGEAHG